MCLVGGRAPCVESWRSLAPFGRIHFLTEGGIWIDHASVMVDLTLSGPLVFWSMAVQTRPCVRGASVV